MVIIKELFLHNAFEQRNGSVCDIFFIPSFLKCFTTGKNKQFISIYFHTVIFKIDSSGVEQNCPRKQLRLIQSI